MTDNQMEHLGIGVLCTLGVSATFLLVAGAISILVEMGCN